MEKGLLRDCSEMFLELPQELHYYILIFINVKDIFSLSRTNKLLSERLKSEIIWKRLLQRDFPNCITKNNYYQAYIGSLRECKIFPLFYKEKRFNIMIHPTDTMYHVLTIIYKFYENQSEEILVRIGGDEITYEKETDPKSFRFRDFFIDRHWNDQTKITILGGKEIVKKWRDSF